MHTVRSLARIFALASCTTTGDVSTGARSLGIESFDIEESDTTLSIRGVDRSNHVVATLELSTGDFMLTDVMGETGGDKLVDGRRLKVVVNGDETRHESEGYARLDLPVNGLSAEAAAFLQVPQ